VVFLTLAIKFSSRVYSVKTFGMKPSAVMWNQSANQSVFFYNCLINEYYTARSTKVLTTQRLLVNSGGFRGGAERGGSRLHPPPFGRQTDTVTHSTPDMSQL